MRWRLDPRTVLKQVALDELTAIYDRRSGQTHIVAAPTPDILAALGGGPTDVHALLKTLGIDDPEAADREALSRRLVELEAAGLVLRG